MKHWKKYLIKLRSYFIIDSNKRKEFRKATWDKQNYHQMRQMKWGASYSVFDGEELLEASLKSIRSEVDYINVVYQLTSWYGRPAKATLQNLLHDLKDKGLIDELMEFVPDLSLPATVNETNKRNLGLERARVNGCDYFMTMDCDELYVSDEIRAAKIFIIENGITHSYCPQIPYGPKPTRLLLYFLTGAGTPFVPFFFKVNVKSKLAVNASTPCFVDPTRQMNAHAASDRYYVLHMVAMHHMSLVRNDLESKIVNSSYKDGKSRLPVSDALTWPYLEVEDVFNINDKLAVFNDHEPAEGPRHTDLMGGLPNKKND